MSATGISDFSVLLERFREMEEGNFKQYRCINDLSKQIEHLEDNNKALEADKEELETMESKTNINRKDFMKEKDAEVKANEEAADKIKQKTAELESEYREASNELENLFYYLELDKRLDKYSNIDHFDIRNVGETLGMVESQQDDMLYLYNLVMSSKKVLVEEPLKNSESNEEETQIKKIGDLLYNSKLTSRDGVGRPGQLR